MSGDPTRLVSISLRKAESRAESVAAASSVGITLTSTIATSRPSKPRVTAAFQAASRRSGPIGWWAARWSRHDRLPRAQRRAGGHRMAAAHRLQRDAGRPHSAHRPRRQRPSRPVRVVRAVRKRRSIPCPGHGQTCVDGAGDPGCTSGRDCLSPQSPGGPRQASPIASNVSIEAALERVKLFECIGKGGCDVGSRFAVQPVGLY